MQLLKKCIAELIGTFVLVLFGCGTAVAVQCSKDNLPGYMLTALAFGLVIVAMAYSIGNISGCHINPAVSIAMLVSKKMTVKEFFAYICAQFIGGIAGGAMLFAIFPASTGLGSNGLYNGNIAASLLIEVILTFVFVLAILGVTSKVQNGAVAGIVIGLSLTLVHIFGIYFTGTSVNPARSFGPAIFAAGDAFANVWVFILAPLVGAVLAALVYKAISCGSEDDAQNKAEVPAVKAASKKKK
ncbi:MAG: MIP family channel protein [Clostridia bacterium]|nr:MIP family channel protein [Clostridia bacterium]